MSGGVKSQSALQVSLAHSEKSPGYTDLPGDIWTRGNEPKAGSGCQQCSVSGKGGLLWDLLRPLAADRDHFPDTGEGAPHWTGQGRPTQRHEASGS